MDAIEQVRPVTAATQPEGEPPVKQPQASPTPALMETLDHEEPEPERSKARTYAILSALFLVLFVAALDQTIIATAIPSMCQALGSATGYVWIGGAYLLGTAATGPIWVKCSDIWGRKPALISAVSLFGAASVLAALSQSMAMLIAGRALQGAASGGLISLVYITIADLFSVRDRSMYIGMLGFMWAVAASTGPLIGGALTEMASWRFAFWINLPVCAFALVLLVFLLDVHNPRTKFSDGIKALDWFGTFSMLAVTLLVLVGLNLGGAVFAWDSPKIICLIVVGTAMIGLFLYNEGWVAKYPLMPLKIFRSWTNSAAIVLTFSHGMVSFGVEFYLPLYFQSVKLASPLRSGILILPMIVTEAAADILVGIMIHKTGRYREFIWAGVTFMMLGLGLFITFDADTSIAQIAGFQIVAGLGIAMLFQAPTLTLQNNVAQANTASATATMGFLRNIATALSIVLGGLVFQNGLASHQRALVEAGLDQALLGQLTPNRAAANIQAVSGIRDPSQQYVVRRVFAASVRNIFVLYTGFAGLALVASLFVKHRKLKEEHQETKTGIAHLADRKDKSEPKS